MNCDHSWRQYGPDEVACSKCGAEPWHRPDTDDADPLPLRDDVRALGFRVAR